MNSEGNTNTKDTKSNVDHKSQGKRDMNNNTAFYRKLKMKHDLKYKKNYPQFFSRPPYLYGVTSKLHHSSKVKHVTGANSKRSDNKGNVEPTKSLSESVRKPYYGEKIKKTTSKSTVAKSHKAVPHLQTSVTTIKPTKDATLTLSTVEPSKLGPPVRT